MAETGANTSLEMAGNCTIPLSLDALLHFSIVYCCFILIVGITCNAMVLWCVARSPRTITSVKVILFAIFSTTLLSCIVQLPLMMYFAVAALLCDRETLMIILAGLIIISNTLARMEIFYIFVMALLRTRAVCTPFRGPLRVRTAVAVVVGVGLYNLFMSMVEVALSLMQVIPSRAKYAIQTAYNVVHYFLPVLLTLACYLLSIVVVRCKRNRLVLTAGQDKGTKLTDEATRAMLAVFLSNLVFVLPISICNILSLDSHFTTIIMFMVFLTHLFVDPLVFVCFNRHHRRRVRQAFKPCLGRPPTEEVAVTPE